MNKRKLFKRGFITISVILGVLFIGNISIRFGILNLFKNHVAEAVNVVDTLGIIKDKNPINILINEEINQVKEEEAKILIKEERNKAAIQAIIDEQIALAEKQINDEKEIERKRHAKIAYLTFDDGPSLVVTPKILDTLDEYGIKATFFVVGNMAERHPEMIQRIYSKEHIIGNHTYSHNYSYIYKNPNNFISDIEKTNKVLKSILGEDFSSDLIRFPGGSFGKSERFIKAAKSAGYRYFDWNSLNGDAEGNRFSKEKLVKRFIETSRNKKKLIVLMHDTDAKETTADALGEMIEYLILQGYEFDTLDNYIE